VPKREREWEHVEKGDNEGEDEESMEAVDRV